MPDDVMLKHYILNMPTNDRVVNMKGLHSFLSSINAQSFCEMCVYIQTLQARALLSIIYPQAEHQAMMWPSSGHPPSGHLLELIHIKKGLTF